MVVYSSVMLSLAKITLFWYFIMTILVYTSANGLSIAANTSPDQSKIREGP